MVEFWNRIDNWKRIPSWEPLFQKRVSHLSFRWKTGSTFFRGVATCDMCNSQWNCRKFWDYVMSYVSVKTGDSKSEMPVSKKTSHMPLFGDLEALNGNIPHWWCHRRVERPLIIITPHISKIHLPIVSLNVREVELKWCSKDQSKEKGDPSTWGWKPSSPRKALRFIKRRPLSS